MGNEPAGGQLGNLVESVRLLEQVAGARYDLEAVRGGQASGGLAVER